VKLPLMQRAVTPFLIPSSLPPLRLSVSPSPLLACRKKNWKGWRDRTRRREREREALLLWFGRHFVFLLAETLCNWKHCLCLYWTCNYVALRQQPSPIPVQYNGDVSYNGGKKEREGEMKPQRSRIQCN
jgi:hypothetical protein